VKGSIAPFTPSAFRLAPRLLSGFATTFSALRHRDFRRLWAGTFCATGGQWVQQATLGWVVFDRTLRNALVFSTVPREDVANGVALNSIAFSLIPSFSALMPVFAVNIFAAGPEGLGLLLSAVGVGGVLGGVASVWTSRIERVGLTQVLGLLGFAASLMGFAMSPSVYVAAAFLVGAGMAEMIHMTANVTTLQMCAPPGLRGRVASLLPMFPALIAVGSFTSGIGADLIGAPALVLLLAAAAAGIVAVAWARSAALRGLRLSRLVARTPEKRGQ